MHEAFFFSFVEYEPSKLPVATGMNDGPDVMDEDPAAVPRCTVGEDGGGRA